MADPRRYDDLLTCYVAGVERHRRVVLLLSAIVCLVSAASIFRLELDADPLNMLPAGRVVFRQYRTYLRRFGGQSTLVALVDAADAPTAVAFAEAFATRLADQPSVASVQYRFDPVAFTRDVLARHLPGYLTPDELAEVRARLEPAAIHDRIAELKTTLTLPATAGLQAFIQHDPLGLTMLPLRRLVPEDVKLGVDSDGGFFLSTDRRATLVLARPRREAFEVNFARRLVNECRALAAELRRERSEWASVRVTYTGGHAHVLSDTATITRDMFAYTIIAPLVMLAIFQIAYRNWVTLPLVSYPLVCGLLATFALSQLIFERLDLISLAFSAIFYGLAIDAGIHLYTRFLQEAHEGNAREAMRRTLHALGRTHLVASTTTAAVFLVLGLSYVRGIAQLGVLTALAMLANVVVTFVIFPALLFSIAGRYPRLVRPAVTLETPRLGHLTRWCGSRRGALPLLALLLLASFAVVRSEIRLDTDFHRLRPTNSEPSRAEADIAARFPVNEFDGAVLTEAPTMELALRRAEAVARVLQPYQDQGLLSGVTSPAALLPSMETQRQRWQQWMLLPRAQAAEALRHALQENGFKPERFRQAFRLLEQAEPEWVVPNGEAQSLPNALTAVAAIHLRHLGEVAAAATFLGTGGRLVELAPRLHADLAANGMPGWLSGRGLMEAELAQVLAGELWLFTSLGLLANVLIVWLSCRSLRMTAAVMIPPLVALALLLAGLHATGGALTPITIVVLPLALGISVDDCLYLAERYHAGGTLEDIGNQNGRAVVITSLTTIVGFGFLAFSHFPGLAELGTLTAMAIGLGLLTAFTTLPPCLQALCSRGAPLRGAP